MNFHEMAAKNVRIREISEVINPRKKSQKFVKSSFYTLKILL